MTIQQQTTASSGKKLLIVEGPDDQKFFEWMLAEMSISGVIIRKVGGSAFFHNRIPFFAQEYDNLEIVAVIRDADERDTSAFQSIRDIFERNDVRTARGEKLTAPDRMSHFTETLPRVGIYIASGEDGIGAIEDVCRFAVAPQYSRRVDCATQLLTCIANLSPSKSKNGKIILQAFLATLHEGDSITCDIGIAAERGYWNFNAPSLVPLKRFLEAFR